MSSCPTTRKTVKKGDFVGHRLGGKGKQKVLASSMQEVHSGCWVAWEMLKVGLEQNLTWGRAVDGGGHLDILKGWIPKKFLLVALAKDLYWQGLCYTGEG